MNLFREKFRYYKQVYMFTCIAIHYRLNLNNRLPTYLNPKLSPFLSLLLSLQNLNTTYLCFLLQTLLIYFILLQDSILLIFQ